MQYMKQNTPKGDKGHCADVLYIPCHFIPYKPVNDKTIIVTIWYDKSNDLINNHLPIHLP